MRNGSAYFFACLRNSLSVIASSFELIYAVLPNSILTTLMGNCQNKHSVRIKVEVNTVAESIRQDAPGKIVNHKDA
jgi:hypothetical protein